MAAHKASELRLTEQGNNLIKTLETTTGDIEQLHGKLGMQRTTSCLQSIIMVEFFLMILTGFYRTCVDWLIQHARAT